MHIRNLRKTDLNELSGLYFQFWNETSDVAKMEQQFDIISQENHHVILVCEHNGKIIGSVMGIVCKELYGDCRPFMVIENMIVDNAYRRQGIGNQLLEKLEEAAYKRNCTQMILVTEKVRADACAFYEEYGFSKDTTGYKKKI